MSDERPLDPDVDLHIPAQRGELERAPWRVLGAIALGGALGALARYGLMTLLPARPGGFVWATFLINVTGCLLIGVLMTAIAALPALPALTRPLLGVGVLGGFTTFSAYVVDVHRVGEAGAPGTALLVLAATPLAALPAVWLGTAVAGALLRRAGVAG